MKFKSSTVRYYTLVEDLKEMIRLEKKWTTEDFDKKVQQFKYSKFTNKKRFRGNPNMNFSMDDAENSIIAKDMFDDDSESENEAEFEAKRVKDAEDKIIKDIFGGKVHFTNGRRMN